MPAFTGPVVAAGSLAHTAQPVLTADELTLRPWLLTDAAAVSVAYDDPAIRQWHARSVTAVEAVAWIEDRNNWWREETGAEWAVTRGGELLGRVGLRHLNLATGRGEVAYWVVPSARGRGVAPRGVHAVARWAFVNVGIHRLELEHSLQNAASCRVAVKAGFELEGTKRSDSLHADGWHDMHLHACVADDPTP